MSNVRAQNESAYPNTAQAKIIAPTEQYKLRLRPGTTIAGAGLIAASFATYAISNTSYSDRLSKAGDKYTDDISELEHKRALGVLTQAEYNTELKKVNDAIARDTRGIKDRQKTINFVCAGVSVAGVIVIAAGLHKEYYRDGILIAENTYCDLSSRGVYLTLKF